VVQIAGDGWNPSGQFRFKTVRILFMILACLLLCLPLWQLLMLPRI
jgi:uncharacterized membrane protein